MSTLLLATILLPLLAAALNHGNAARMRWIALVATVTTFGMAVVLLAGFPGGTAPYAVVDVPWLRAADTGVDVRFNLGLDGLSLWFFGLTALLMITSVLVSWQAIHERGSTFYGLLLLLETGMLGVFAARDIILFYIFFEFTLIPLFFLIGVWGSEERRYAAIKFFLFTFAGSMLTFLGLLAIVLWNYSQTGHMTFSIAELTTGLVVQPMASWMQLAVFGALFAGFAIKVPLFPLHTWLPLAHVQAPTAGSVLLAGVLLKVGGYGFVRFCLPMVPEAVAMLMPWLLGISVIGIVYGALVALVQDDIKRLIAFSSVSHLGFCMLGVFAINRLGMQGGVLQMLNHGLSTGGLFALVGMLYERYHSRKIDDFSGLAQRMPVLAFFFVVMTLSSIGLPGLNGFAGEFTLLLGMFYRAWGDAPAAWVWPLRTVSVLATLGVVLGAWYMLLLVQRVFFGPMKERKVSVGPGHDSAHNPVCDLSLREVLALAPLCVFIVWIGVWPSFFLSRMSPVLDQIVAVPAAAVQTLSGREKPAIGAVMGREANPIGMSNDQ